MINLLKILFVSLLFTSYNLFASSILQVGNWHAEDLIIPDNKKWLSLKIEKGEWNLIEDNPKFIYHNDDPITGSGIIIKTKSKSFRFIFSDNGLTPGKVLNIVSYNDSFDSTRLPKRNKFKKFSINENEYILKNDNGFISLVKDNIKQRLFKYNDQDENNAQIEWIGDLDQDGKLDLIINASDNYNSDDIRLYLSGSADDGKLVRLISSMITTGC